MTILGSVGRRENFPLGTTSKSKEKEIKGALIYSMPFMATVGKGYVVRMPCLHAALLETCGQSCLDTGHSCPVRQFFFTTNHAESRLTLVSEGNSLRCLLFGSKKNSLIQGSLEELTI